jgi:hypothetical protein
MRLPDRLHAQQPWRVHALAVDFPLEDLWEFPVVLDPARGQSFADFQRFLASDLFPHLGRSGLVGRLFALRWWLGRRLGWDAPGTASHRDAPPAPAESLSHRVPADWRPPADAPRGGPGRPVYAFADETLAEVSNRTVHGLIHLGWVARPERPGTYAVRLAVYAQPRGRLGRVYMALIRPFRLWIVYPTLMRQAAERWPVFVGRGVEGARAP